MSTLRNIIRRNLIKEYALDGSISVYPANDKGGFPYSGIPSQQRPENIDSIADYVNNWTQLYKNNDMYEFPTQEFNLGLKIEKQRNPQLNILEIADKVIQQLKGDSQFYSKLKDRFFFGRRKSNEF